MFSDKEYNKDDLTKGRYMVEVYNCCNNQIEYTVSINRNVCPYKNIEGLKETN